VPLDEQLLGPFALLVGALFVVKVLWDEHKRQDARTEAQSTVWQSLATATEADLHRIADVLERILGERLHKP